MEDNKKNEMCIELQNKGLLSDSNIDKILNNDNFVVFAGIHSWNRLRPIFKKYNYTKRLGLGEFGMFVISICNSNFPIRYFWSIPVKGDQVYVDDIYNLQETF